MLGPAGKRSANDTRTMGTGPPVWVVAKPRWLEGVAEDGGWLPLRGARGSAARFSATPLEAQPRQIGRTDGA